MAVLDLSLAYGKNPRTSSIISGAIKPDGIEFNATVASMPELAWRQLEFHDFDVSELSMSSLTIAISKGDTTFVGLPIFTTRFFCQTRILVREDSGIESPQQLVGKRIGVPEHQQTAALWSRGILADEYGVEATSMRWFMERLPERSHGGATGFEPPVGLDFQYIPEQSNIGEMMLAGELDAALLYIRGPNLVDRSSVDLAAAPGIRALFPDAIAEGDRYYRKTGFYPINHGAVIKRSIADKYPWAPVNIYKAFLQAKEASYNAAQQALQPLVECGLLANQSLASHANDPMPYGVASNRKILETMTKYSFEQGLTARQVGLEELFHPSTMEL